MKEHRPARRQGEASALRMLSATEFHPIAQFIMPSALHSAENRAAARTQILDWAGESRPWRDGWSGSIPDKAYEGRPFDAADDGVHIEVRADSENKMWCFEVEHDDSRDPARHWRLEAFVADRETHDEMGVRVFCQPGAPTRFVPSNTPAIVKSLVRDNHMVDAGSPVTSKPLEADHDDSFEDFLDLLLSRERKLPLVLLTERRGARAPSYTVSPEKCAQILQGFAHVVALPEEQSSWLGDELGRAVSAFGGAIRTYMPGFHAEANPYDHPLYLPERIEQRSGGWTFEQTLARKLRALTVDTDSKLALWPQRPEVREVARVPGFPSRERLTQGLKKALGALKRA